MFMNKFEIDLDQLRHVAHPFREPLRRHRITNPMIAKFLGVSYSYANNMINGIIKMPAHHEQKLQTLVDQLEGNTK